MILFQYENLMQTHLWEVFGQPHVGKFKGQKWSKYRLKGKKTHHTQLQGFIQ